MDVNIETCLSSSFSFVALQKQGSKLGLSLGCQNMCLYEWVWFQSLWVCVACQGGLSWSPCVCSLPLVHGHCALLAHSLGRLMGVFWCLARGSPFMCKFYILCSSLQWKWCLEGFSGLLLGQSNMEQTAPRQPVTWYRNCFIGKLILFKICSLYMAWFMSLQKFGCTVGVCKVLCKWQPDIAVAF